MIFFTLTIMLCIFLKMFKKRTKISELIQLKKMELSIFWIILDNRLPWKILFLTQNFETDMLCVFQPTQRVFFKKIKKKRFLSIFITQKTIWKSNWNDVIFSKMRKITKAKSVVSNKKKQNGNTRFANKLKAFTQFLVQFCYHIFFMEPKFFNTEKFTKHKIKKLRFLGFLVFQLC